MIVILAIIDFILSFILILYGSMYIGYIIADNKDDTLMVTSCALFACVFYASIITVALIFN